MQSITDTLSIRFDNSYAALAPEFYERLEPTPVSAPQLVSINDALALQLGIDSQGLKSPDGIAMLAGNALPVGADPIAMAYAGHQFGNWVPQLGDGRAILLGEVVDRLGVRYDIQLKGAGRTPFSRGGDGRNWIGPVLREYLVSEAMAALRVPTTRALAAVTTGDYVLREQGPLPGAILTRVARSHIRVGTFQYFAARQNDAAIEQLVQHVIARHYPHAVDAENPTYALLDAVIDAQAALVAHWQSLGFIHGVMNTDNTSISGETIDYGPCAFMDTYMADRVFSSIDRGARYAYQNQPRIAQWNLVNLAQCLLPLLHTDKEQAVQLAQQSINRFDECFVGHYLARMRPKLGLPHPHGSDASDRTTDSTTSTASTDLNGSTASVGSAEPSESKSSAHSTERDLTLISDLLTQMQRHQLDFTITFRQLTRRSATDPFAPGGKLHDWHLRWQQRCDQLPGGPDAAIALMATSNPVIIPRNHQVEAVIDAAVKDQDFAPFHAMLAAVTTPFDERHDGGIYAAAPSPEEVVTQTFCGT